MAEEALRISARTATPRYLRPLRSAWRLAKAKPLGAVSAVLLVLVWGVVILAPVLSGYRWDDLFTGPKLAAPTFEGRHLMGTDNAGRDILSRVLYGGRLTLTTSIIATVGAVTLALLAGVISGYFLGLYDLVFQRVADSLQALPGLVVLMVVAAAFNQSRIAVLLVLMVLQAPGGGRVLRSQTLVVRNLAYVEAARSLGASNVRVLLRHILPNVLPLVIVIFSISVGANMLILTSLSFLGVIDPSKPDWGGMLNVATQQYLIVAPWTAIFPGVAITLGVLAYNLLGDAARDILDPRLRGSR